MGKRFMLNPHLHKAAAIGSMIWSLLAGAGGLLGIRLIQVTGSSGHPTTFPMELVAFYASVEALLLVVFLGILRRCSWAVAALPVLLASILLTTILCLRSREWAPDFLRNALILEAIWLGPWLLTLSRPGSKSSKRTT